jgi:predicted PurR-regulated permease PerM
VSPALIVAAGVMSFAVLLGLGIGVYLVVRPFLIPLGWAAVFAVAVYPVFTAVERRWGSTRAAAASTAAVTLILVLPALILMPIFVREGLDVAGRIQQAFMEGRFAWLERVWNDVAGRLPGAEPIDLASVSHDATRRGVAFAISQSGAVLRNTVVSIVDLVIALFAMFFLLRDSRVIVRGIRRLLPLPADAREDLIGRTITLVTVGVTSAVMVAAAQGLLGGLAFFAVGFESPVFWGAVMGLFCLLPFGAWVVWAPMAVLLAADGHIGRALVLAALGFVIVSGADNVLRPMLLSGRTHMNGLVVLVGLLGGMAAFGLLGLVLGPIVVATALTLVAAYVDVPAQPAWRSWARQLRR